MSDLVSVQELIIAAAKLRGNELRVVLQKADVRLAQLKHWARVCQELNLWQVNQYEHIARMLNDCGKLLGAWIKHVGSPKSSTSSDIGEVAHQLKGIR